MAVGGVNGTTGGRPRGDDEKSAGPDATGCTAARGIYGGSRRRDEDAIAKHVENNDELGEEMYVHEAEHDKSC